MCDISKQSALARLLKRAKLLVWDEACMSSKYVTECVDRSLRDICSCDLPFGGKVIVFGGDFRQILPVVKHGSRAAVVSVCINNEMIHIDRKYVVPGDKICDLVSSVYGKIKENYADSDYIAQRIILCPKNETCDLINNYVIDQLPGKCAALFSADSLEESATANFPKNS